ncbi:MAG: amidohydrolase family protein [Planctomycetota bacterium]
MENDIASNFLLIEYLLKNKEPAVINRDNTFTIGDVTFKKIILTPLILDFRYKHTDKPYIFYNAPPRKPIIAQVFDLFNGIKIYCENKIVKKGAKLEYEKDNKDSKLFEIYPFLGLNTRHYDCEQLEKMLNNKYFRDYTGCQQSFYANMGKFNGDIENIGSNYFAGIKVYPPFGFDPWPDDKYERQKVEILYDCCIRNGLPITTHCSTGGFKVKEEKDTLKYTAPGMQWKKVLEVEKYSELKINFAHFGLQSKSLWLFHRKQWRDSIIELISKYPNVYTDISDLSLSDKGCKYIEDVIEKEKSNNKRLENRVLFGSDFLVSLIWTNSYNELLNDFKETNYLKSYKEKICSRNPEEFLFKQ